MSKHTELPWRVSESKREPNLVKIGTGDGGWLGLAHVFGDSDEEAEANAEFIVRAVNCHDDLLEACRRAMEAMQKHAPIYFNTDICRLQAQIAKAEKETP